MAGGLTRLEVRGDGTILGWIWGTGRRTLALRWKEAGQVRDVQETEIEKGVAVRLECCRGAQATARVQPMEVTEGLGEGGGGLSRERQETASQTSEWTTQVPLDCKREWRRKGGCSGGFLSNAETEQVFRLRGEASGGDSSLGRKVRMPLVQELRLQRGGRGGGCGGGGEEGRKPVLEVACGR